MGLHERKKLYKFRFKKREKAKNDGFAASLVYAPNGRCTSRIG